MLKIWEVECVRAPRGSQNLAKGQITGFQVPGQCSSAYLFPGGFSLFQHLPVLGGGDKTPCWEEAESWATQSGS